MIDVRNKVRRFSYVLEMLGDTILIVLSFIAVYYSFKLGLKAAPGEIYSYISIGVYVLLHLLLCALSGQYTHMWQYSGLKDFAKFYIFALFTGLAYVATAFVIDHSMSMLLLSLFVVLSSTNIMMLERVILKFAGRKRDAIALPKVKLAIIGAGFTASSLLSNMETAKMTIYEPVCVFDDDPVKIGKSINGVKVVGTIDEAPAYCKAHGITDIIIAIPSASNAIKKRIINKLADETFKLSMIPSVEEMINAGDKNYWSAVREVRVEDLLGRDVIKINDSTVRSYVSGKVVMVTGGGGSIGSELCRQIAANDPKQLIILDIYENNAYEIQQELIRTYKGQLNLSVEIASVRDHEKIDLIFSKYRPEIVYHAAAHKHVPLMETNPEEAIKNNVFGTYNTVMAADKYGAEKFLLISSDKAVNPTNVMGATKRCCEMIVQSMKDVSNTKYVAVRFGNVLGSNGSVVPLFKKQIAAGGPVTVTHRDIIRYFMTIPEAVQLVLITGAKAETGNVYVLDMGEPVRIDDFAKKMINLSGYRPNVDIKIEYTGLRPGEKLFEELLIDQKTSVRTEHERIFIEQLPTISRDTMDRRLKCLQEAVKDNDGEAAVDGLLRTVSTFHHNGEENRYAASEMVLPLEKSIAEKKKVVVGSSSE